jgi:hypothetical protein
MLKRFRAMTWRQRTAATTVLASAFAALYGINSLATWFVGLNNHTVDSASRSGFTLGMIFALMVVPLINKWIVVAYHRLSGQKATVTE